MICRIAEIIVEIPEAGGITPRCEEYRCEETAVPDIVLSTEYKNSGKYPDTMSQADVAYMESAAEFCFKLIPFGGMYLHASAVEFQGYAYLFSGPCGMGKSTHSRMWQQTFGSAAQVFNDDKPVLRRVDGKWFAYGTPWCGKDGINQNKKVPLAGICFLKQAEENKIRRLNKQEAFQKIFSQTMRQFKQVEMLDRVIQITETLVQEIPVFELENRPEPAAALLSYEAMRPWAEGDQK